MTCVLWDGRVNDSGYGTRYRRGQSGLVHRQVYCDHHNVDLKTIIGLCVRHSCDTPRCINPEHLLLGTHDDNMQDKATRNRTKCMRATNRVLDIDTVRKMRAEYIPGKRGFGMKALAKKYGIVPSHAHYILSNTGWIEPSE